MKNKIVKQIFQTSKEKQPEYLRDQILAMASGWDYVHFTDEDIYKYFDDNPMEEFPDIKKKFNEIPKGQHRADLFRYFYMYQNGGLFIDSDLSIEKSIDEIVGDCEIMTVISKIDKRAFNGLLYANKNNKIIYICLKHLYNVSNQELEYYHSVCEFLYKTLKRCRMDVDLKLHFWDHWDGHEFPHAMYDKDGNLITLHYWKDKVVPKK